MQDSAEAFDCRDFEFAEIRDCHQSRGFRTKELLECRSQPSGDMHRNLFDPKLRHLLTSLSALGLTKDETPIQDLRPCEPGVVDWPIARELLAGVYVVAGDMTSKRVAKTRKLNQDDLGSGSPAIRGNRKPFPVWSTLTASSRRVWAQSPKVPGTSRGRRQAAAPSSRCPSPGPTP